jgi:hypothetical protein
VRIIVASTFVPFQKDRGAAIVDDLGAELIARGFQADVVKLPFASTPNHLAEQVLGLRLLDLSESSGERIDRLVAVGGPCCALRHPNKTAWFLHPPAKRSSADAGFRPDQLYLGECSRVFAHARGTSNRLRRLHGIEALLLRPPRPGRRGAAWDHVIESLIS